MKSSIVPRKGSHYEPPSRLRSASPKPRSRICANGLRRTRWPEPERSTTGPGGAAGLCAGALRSWAEDYDFGFAKRLNAFPQFRDTVDGLGIHFLTSARPSRTPSRWFLRTGAGGSVLEFLEVLGPLTDRARTSGDSGGRVHVVARRAGYVE